MIEGNFCLCVVKCRGDGVCGRGVECFEFIFRRRRVFWILFLIYY